MKRIGPVIIVSLLVNFFLFLMMTQMVIGKKVRPKEQADFQGIELIDFKAHDLGPKEIRGAKAERPVLPEPPPMKIDPSPPAVQPKPAPPKLKRTEPRIEKIKPVIHPEPPLEKFEPDLLLPEPIPIEERPDPVPLPEKVVELDLSPLKNIKAPVIDQNLLSSEDVQPIENAQPVPSEAAVPPSKNIEATLSEERLSTLKTSAETVESEDFQADALEADVVEVDVLPLLRTRPGYPRRAIRAKLEGMVTIEFTIQTDGSVSDPIVVASAPPKVFDRAALRAIRKWKFRPKQVKGKAVIRRAIQNIRFSLKSGKK